MIDEQLVRLRPGFAFAHPSDMDRLYRRQLEAAVLAHAVRFRAARYFLARQASEQVRECGREVRYTSPQIVHIAGRRRQCHE